MSEKIRKIIKLKVFDEKKKKYIYIYIYVNIHALTASVHGCRFQR
jgi:hypothetical protein